MADVLELFQTGSSPPGGKTKKSEDEDVLSMFPTEVQSAPKEAEPAPSLGPLHSKPDAGTAAFMRIYGAAGEGYQNTPPLLTPEARAAVEKGGPVGRYVVNPLLDLGSMVFKGLGAFGGAVGQSGAEVGTATGRPELGRDINMLAQVAPLAEMGAGVPRIPSAPEAPPAPPRYVQEYYGEGTAANPLAAYPPKPAPAFVPPGTNLPPEPLYRTPEGPNYQGGPIESPSPSPAFVPPETTSRPPLGSDGRPLTAEGQAAAHYATPEPQSVGAGASREGTPADMLTAQTPGQRIAALEKSVTQTAEERAGPQMRDDNPYVEGIPPRTLAGRDFSQSVNQLDEKVAYAKDQEFRDKVDKVNRERNEGMVDLLRKDAGDPIALEKAHEDRAAVSPDALGVFKDEKPVDAAGLVATIDELLKGPDGKQAAVRNTLKSVRDSLFDSDGNIETLPSQLYGARKNLTDLLKKGVKGVGDAADDVRASKHILTGLLPTFDDTISSGAPKFKDEYLKKWAELSEPINRMEFLQQYQTGSKKLTGPDGYLQPTKVQKMLDDILQAHKASGVNGAKRLTPEEIQNVINVRNELAAQSLQRRLEGVRGSDTFQQMNRPGVFGRGPIGGLTREALLAIPTVGVGNLLYHYGIKPGMEIKRANRIARQEAARKDELLAPPSLLNPP